MTQAATDPVPVDTPADNPRRLSPEQQRRVEECMPLVRKLSVDFARRQGLDFAEVTADACYQVVLAALRYDPARGRFTTCVWATLMLHFRDYYARRLNRALKVGGQPTRSLDQGRMNKTTESPRALVNGRGCRDLDNQKTTENAGPKTPPSARQDGTAMEVDETVLEMARRLTPLEFAVLYRHHGLGETLAEIGRGSRRNRKTLSHTLERARAKLRRCPEAADAFALVGRRRGYAA